METSHKSIIIFGLLILLALNLAAWFFILSENNLTEIDFLDVGQGDAILMNFYNSGKIMIDAGPNRSVLDELGSNLNFFEKKIDILILSHANLDHYGGFFEVIEKYHPRVFVYNGVNSTSETFQNLLTLIKNNGLAVVSMKAGDKIKIGDDVMEIISPLIGVNFSEKNLNNSSLVFKTIINSFKTLFLGDADSSFLKKIMTNWQADILKVSHHGSKNGTDEALLNLINPKIALIGVGEDNKYNHPADTVINLLEDLGIEIFRTDQDGGISIQFGKELIIGD
jgi:competence protein ComEC